MISLAGLVFPIRARFFRALGSGLLLVAGCWLAASPVAAQPGVATGAIEGRVLDAATGNYVKRARISIEGSALETFTNEYGEYRLAGVPAGAATVRVFYTGLGEQAKPVAVGAGQTAQQDFMFARASEGDAVVQLGEFKVTGQRETDMTALAINEQRFAGNLKNVVAANQFGDVTEGNVGEFVKFLPGISVDYNAADARTIAVRGLPSANTPVTMDGNRLASAASSSATRTFELEQVSMNNVARVEVTKVPTPDVSAEGLGGVVNLVSKSSFERAKPQLDYRAYLSANSYNLSLAQTPGPGRDPHRFVRPGFDVTYVNPVSRNFGFVLNLLSSRQYNREERSQNQWAPVNLGLATVGTTPVTAENPVLLRYAVQDGRKLTNRDSFGGSIDWRFAPLDVLSVRFTYGRYDSFFADENINWNVGTATAFGPSFTQGSTSGDVQIGTNFRRKSGFTWTPSIAWKHVGSIWKLEAGAALSRSQNNYRDFQKGFIENANYRITNVSIRFDDIYSLRPRSIAVTSTATTPTATGAGQPVSSFVLDNYTLFSVRSSENASVDLVKSANASVSRIVDLGTPITVRLGADYRKNSRDIRYPQSTWNYVGPDGRQNSADDRAGALVSPSLSRLQPPYSLPAFQWPDPYLTYDLYKAHPEYFSQVVTGTSGVLFNTANNSKNISEEIPAGYLRADAHLFQHRLWIVAGARYERTLDEGQGILNDPNAIYRRDAAGHFALDAAGNKILLTSDAVQQAQLMYQDRGSRARRSYDGYYPSLNLTYTLADNFILRGGYAQTIGRPDYSNIIPGTTVTLASGNTTGLIAVNNTGLKPWQANSYDLSLEYYFRQTGLVSFGVFRKDIANFFGSVRTTATPELLALYNLNPEEFTGYDISYKFNSGDARVTGMEFNYSQKLTLLPPWARGLSMFANATLLHLQGTTVADFSGFNPKVFNWGFNFARGKLSANLKWNANGQKRNAAVTGAGIAPGTYEYIHARLMVDADVSYAFHPRLRLFATARNIANKPLITERYAPTTPNYARIFRFENFGVQCAFGVKGTF